MDALLDALETLRLRLLCGQTLSAALVGLPECRAPARVGRAWIRLRDRALAGEIPAEAALRAWIAHLRLEQKIRGLVRQRTLGPRAQAHVIRALAWLFWLASLVLFPAELRPGFTFSAVSAALLGAGTLWMRWLVARASAGLWNADWLVFLSKIAAALGWGQTFGPALQGAWEEHGAEAEWPRALRAAVGDLLGACRAYEGLPGDWPAPPGSREPELTRALEQLRALNRLREAGQPLAEFLSTCVHFTQENLDRRLSLRAEALAMRLLLPLFVCFLPAFLTSLFGPVLRLALG